MRPPGVRFTVRRMLVAVGAVGIAMGAWVVANRRGETFRECARHHAEQIFGIEEEITPNPNWEDSWLSDHPEKRPPAGSFHPPGWSAPSAEDPPPVRAWRMSQARRIAYHEALKRKYEHASHYPWLPVRPDPPEPD